MIGRRRFCSLAAVRVRGKTDFSRLLVLLAPHEFRQLRSVVVPLVVRGNMDDPQISLFGPFRVRG